MYLILPQPVGHLRIRSKQRDHAGYSIRSGRETFPDPLPLTNGAKQRRVGFGAAPDRFLSKTGTDLDVLTLAIPNGGYP